MELNDAEVGAFTRIWFGLFPEMRSFLDAKCDPRNQVITLTGRMRSDVSYTESHNTLFQGLAADGAKIALWLLLRASYRVVNCLHDEFLIEVPAGSDLLRHAQAIEALMLEAMKSVAPDVDAAVEFAAMSCWNKQAQAVYDEKGTRLLLWRPPVTKKAMSNAAGTLDRSRLAS